MPRITLDLPDTTFQHLRRLAEEEERDTRGQAIYLIRRALNRRPAPRPDATTQPRELVPAG